MPCHEQVCHANHRHGVVAGWAASWPAGHQSKPPTASLICPKRNGSISPNETEVSTCLLLRVQVGGQVAVHDQPPALRALREGPVKQGNP